MGKIICFTNQAGGVGKSTTVVNLAAFLSEDNKVLVVDADGQQTSTMNSGINPYECELSLYDGMVNKASFSDVVQGTEYGYDIVPASEELYMTEIALATRMGRENQLKRFLAPAVAFYDLILVDMPPNLGLLQVNGLVAADSVVIVCQSQPKSFNGLDMLLSSIGQAQTELGTSIELEGVVVTLYEKNTKVAEKVMAQLRKHTVIKDKIFDSVIRKNVTLAEANNVEEITLDDGGYVILGMPIKYYEATREQLVKKHSNGYQDYLNLSKEIQHKL